MINPAPIPAALPEEEGVSPTSILNLLGRLQKDQIPMHSLLIARHGHLIFEGYFAPYTGHTLHRMFSVTKSLVSLGIGCLEASGALAPDDPICLYFPEYTPADPHPWLASMTIRHMLQMKSCHKKTTYNKFSTAENWVESFFTTKPDHMPGTIFNYDTSASHVLCALIEKLSRQKMLDYLRQQFLDDIGFSRDAYILSDPFGVSMGGSGLMALPSDLMRLGLFMLDHGKHKGRQLYPAAYLADATSFHSSTLMKAPIPEEGYGYGYQFWQISHGGYACYGMGGQLLLCYPAEDLVIVTTADTQDIKGGNQLIYNGIYEELFPCLSDPAASVPSSASRSLFHAASQLTLPVLNPVHLALCPLPPVQYRLEQNPGDFLELKLAALSEKTWELTLIRENRCCSYPFGFGHLEQGIMEPYGQRYAASAAFVEKHTLYIRFWLIDTSTASIHIQICFTGRQITVSMRKTEETMFEEFQGFLSGTLTG